MKYSCLILLFFLISCSAKKEVVSENEKPNPQTGTISLSHLAGIKWQLSEMDGKPVQESWFDREAAHFTINEGGTRLSGYAGCNSMNSQVEIEGPVIQFHHIATTRKACGEGNRENAFLVNFQKNHTVSIQATVLILTSENGEFLKFIRILE